MTNYKKKYSKYKKKYLELKINERRKKENIIGR